MGNNITNKRIDELDYIRGFALLGIILVNILALLNIKIPDPNTVDASYQRFLYLFVEGRFFSIFSFLFGWDSISLSLEQLRREEWIRSISTPLSCTIYFRFDSLHVSTWRSINAICNLRVNRFAIL